MGAEGAEGGLGGGDGKGAGVADGVEMARALKSNLQT